MSDKQILPILVAARSQNVAEYLNGVLRGVGLRVHAEWADDAEALEKCLGHHAELLFFIIDDPGVGLEQVVQMRDLHAPGLPIIALSKAEGGDVAAAMAKGARDLIVMTNTAHLKAVIARELTVARTSTELRRQTQALADYEKRLNALLNESADAIAYLQDGVHMNANPAYLQLFGYAAEDDIVGIPVMDLFDSASQNALKAALQEGIKHSKSTHGLKTRGRDAAGQDFDATLSLEPDVLDGEACLRLTVHVAAAQASPELEQQLSEREKEAAALKASLVEIRHRDPLTGLYHRGYFLDQLRKVKAGDKIARALALVSADQFDAVEAAVGAFASNKVIEQFVGIIKKSVNQNEPAARFGDQTFAIVLSRPALKDIEDWARKLCETVAKTVFETDNGSTSMTCSIGLTEIDPLAGSELLLSQAMEASHAVAGDGGNRYLVYQPEAVGEGEGGSDAGWVKRISNALKNEGLRLVYQPIANLDGSDTELQDVLVQMQTGEKQIIPAAEFLPYAERHGLMTAIDKWVIAHVLPVLAAEAKKGARTRFLVRISRQSLIDAKMLAWIKAVLAKLPNMAPGSLVFQVPEAYLDKHLKETKLFIDTMQKARCAIAIVQFGRGRNSLGVLDHLKPNFIKLDDELVRDMHTEHVKRESVTTLVSKAKSQQIETIVQRVESADTIAILWQMGVQYIQGNYLQEPGTIVAAPTRRAMDHV